MGSSTSKPTTATAVEDVVPFSLVLTADTAALQGLKDMEDKYMQSDEFKNEIRRINSLIRAAKSSGCIQIDWENTPFGVNNLFKTNMIYRHFRKNGFEIESVPEYRYRLSLSWKTPV